MTIPQQLQKPLLVILVTLVSAAIVLPMAFGVGSMAKKYTNEVKVFMPGELPFYESDSYKWVNWTRRGGIEDPSELKIGDNPVLVQWPSPNRYYLLAVSKAFETIFDHPAAGNWGFFYSMPILAIIMAMVYSIYALYRLNDWFTAIVIPLFISSVPAVYTQLFASRPDHHGIILLFIGLFVMSMTSARKSVVAPAIFGAMSIWLSVVSFIPILGLMGLAAILTKAKIHEPTGLRYESSAFWKQWAYWTCGLAYAAWLFDFSSRGFHMEVINPLWVLSVGAGGLFLSEALSQNPKRIKMIVWLALAAAAPLACTDERLFWTASEAVTAFHRDVFELVPGKPAEYIQLLPFGFVALALAGGEPRTRLLALMAGLISTMYLWQVRWLPIAVLPVLIVAARSPAIWGTSRAFARGAVMSLLVFQLIWATTSTLQEGIASWRSPKTAPETFSLASFGAVLRNNLKSLPPGEFIGTPNMTAYVHHFTGRKGVGSVYWESKESMEAAAKILSAQPGNDAWAKSWLRDKGIRYIILTPKLFSGPYQDMNNQEKLKNSLEMRLVTGRTPAWLEVLLNLQEPWPGLLIAKVKDIGDK